MPEQEILDDKDREILLWIALGLSFDIRVFSERLGQEIERLRRSGVSEQSIIGVLGTDFKPIQASFLGQIGIARPLQMLKGGGCKRSSKFKL